MAEGWSFPSVLILQMVAMVFQTVSEEDLCWFLIVGDKNMLMIHTLMRR